MSATGKGPLIGAVSQSYALPGRGLLIRFATSPDHLASRTALDVVVERPDGTTGVYAAALDPAQHAGGAPIALTVAGAIPADVPIGSFVFESLAAPAAASLPAALQAKRDRVRRFFAAFLGGGGVFGIGIGAWVALRYAQQSVALVAFVAILVALYAWAAYTGLQLWRGTPYGWRWGRRLYASQIPMFAWGGLHYEWFTGALVAFGVELGSEFKLTAHWTIGANAQFGFGSTAAPVATFAVNVFALVAYLMLREPRSAA